MIIDEAAQCSEPSALIPLRRGCSQCIMVGDPMQLSAVIFSDKAKKSGYGTSLFERLSKTGNDSLLLNVQYRMDPSISGFASNMFYDNELKDGENVLVPTFRPSYLNGINTKNGFQYKDAIKEYQSVLESENKEKEGMKSSSSAASFLSSLNTYQGIPNTKMILNNKNSMEKKKINIADDVESSMTLKPFLFFDLTTSQDVSNPSMSHSNIGDRKSVV